MIRIIFAVIFISNLLPRCAAAEKSPPGDAALGSVHGGLLYSISNKRYTIESGCTTARLIRISLAPSPADAARAKEHIQVLLENETEDLRANQPVRWRIVTDVFWDCSLGVFKANTTRLKVSDLDLCDDNDPKALQKMNERYRRVFEDQDIGAYFQGWSLDPIRDHAENMRRLPMLQGLKGVEDMVKINRELAFFDFLPITPISGRMFLLEDKKCKIWSVLGEFKAHPISPLRSWRLTYSKDPLAVIDLGFTEPFTVFSHGGSYFFLTRSCKLYSATKSADDKWKVEKLWSEANRPIHSVITDTATNRSYAFTQSKADKDGKKPADVYFEFDTKLAPVEFDRAKLKSYKLDPPLDMLRSYTQVLIDAKKIDPTPPKKKD